jgi:hypothetical protein
MYLSIILTIFVVLQITTLVLIYKWWDKYGRTIFKSFTEMKTGFPGGMNNSNSPNLFDNIPDMKEMMKQLNQMNKMRGNR